VARVDWWAALDSEDPRIGIAEIAVYSVLARHANGTGVCYPSYPTLMRQTKITSRTTMSKALRNLRAVGLIAVETSGRNHLYHMMMTESDQSRKWTSPENGPVHNMDRTSPENGPIPVQKMDSNYSIELPNELPKVSCAPQDDFALQLPSSTPKTKRSTPPDTTLVADFETWWQKYPRKRDKAKALSLYRSWRKDGKAADYLLRAAIHYAEECEMEGREERYIRHPATFLSRSGSSIDDYQTPPEPPRPRERQTDYYDDGMDIHV
jgi:hypothetical protein